MEFSRNLYIADDVKWSIVDAVLNKRIKESIFWLNEYYSSGYENKTWETLFVIYSCFYYTNNSYYDKKIWSLYNKWLINKDFKIILEIVYRFYKMKKYDCIVLNIVLGNLKCKNVNINVDKKTIEKIGLKTNNLYFKLVKSLQAKHYKNIWFFLMFNYEKSLEIIKKYYENSALTINNSKICDKKIQVLMFIMKQNMKKIKRKNFKIKVKNELLEYYTKLIKKKEVESYKILELSRSYKIPEAIGCFNLERFNYSEEELENMYFYKWMYYANMCPYWNCIFNKWCIEFDEQNKEPIFMNEELEEKFYEIYNLEPDEQKRETHLKSLCKIDKYNMNNWIEAI